MATISGVLRKCTICGEPLASEGARCECKYCGSIYEFANPQMEDELQTANAFRECTRFEEAETLYKQILKKYREYDLSEVYWNLLLCEQRVMFETDEKGERFPSFYAITDDEIEDSLYYLGAIGAAEKKAPERVEIFKNLAEKMIRVKQLYARIADTSKPFDMFICFKKSAFEGGDTKDCALATDLYNHLAKDYNIFFSERSLKNVVVREFEPNIYYGLYTAKVMLVLCSKKEYVESQWLKNEWARFHAFAQNPATGKTIIPIFLEDFSPRSLPSELISYQGLPADYHLFDELGKTLRNILKPVDMEAELDRKMQALLAEQRRLEEERLEAQRRQMEEQQHQMQKQLEAMRKAQEQIDAQKEKLEALSHTGTGQPPHREPSTHESGKRPLQKFNFPHSTKKGDYIKFGTYKQNEFNNKEAIEWLVLDVKDNKALVISKYALDCKQYNTNGTEVTWETCSLRKWLNNDFINTAFSAEEKVMIPTVRVSADKNPEYKTNPGKVTQDKVFLLSVAEANKYFGSYSAKQCKPTAYTASTGAYVDSAKSNCWWWLRSPGYYQYLATAVYFDGNINVYGSYVYRDSIAVRPAMWIDLNS